MSTAAINCPSRKFFAPMFRSRWQNMQNIVTDSAYLSRIPAAYKTYYSTYINQWLAWSRGFVPTLHSRDFFATCVGNTVINVLTKLCMHGGYHFDSSDDETRKKLHDWQKDELSDVFEQMFWHTNSGGNCLLVITPIHGELVTTAYPINRCYFQIGRNNEVTFARLLNRFVAGEYAYYAEETRIYHDGVPYMMVRLATATPVTSPSWGDNYTPFVPPVIRAQWEYQYGEIEPGKWYAMPERMRGIGVYNVKNRAVASAMSDIPAYSDSSLHGALDVLYSIDYNYTQGQVDQYLGKSTALIPKQMSARRVGTVSQGMSYGEIMDESFQPTPLDDQFYTQVSADNIDGKPIQPMFLQPDLRAESRKYIRDADLELLATKVGLSVASLIPSKAGGGTKTDDQISAEGTLEEKTVSDKRALASRAINCMLRDVAYFYELKEDVTIVWGSNTSNNMRTNEELRAEYNDGLLTLRDYLKKRWIEASDEEIERMAREIEAEQKKRQSFETVPAEYADNDELG